MNKLNRHSSLLSLMILLLISVFIPSCDRLNKDPLFIGTWQHKDIVDTGDLVFNTTRTLILTKTTYEEIYMLQRYNSDAVLSIIGFKGGLSTKGSEMTFNLEEIGTCVKDASQNCTDQVVFYGQGTQYYIDNIQYFRLIIEGEYEADENYLQLKRDTNGDGDMEDNGESIEFQRI